MRNAKDNDEPMVEPAEETLLRRHYSAPSLINFGAVRTLTQAGTVGNAEGAGNSLQMDIMG